MRSKILTSAYTVLSRLDKLSEESRAERRSAAVRRLGEIACLLEGADVEESAGHGSATQTVLPDDPSDVSLDMFLEGLLRTVQQELGVDVDAALDVLSTVINSLIDSGELPELPEAGGDTEQATLWMVHALQKDIVGLLAEVMRGVAETA